MNNISITLDSPLLFSQSKNAHTAGLDNSESLSISRGSCCPANRRRWVIGSAIFLFSILLTGSLWLTFSSITTQKIQMPRIYSRLFSANSFFVSKILVTNAALQNEGPVVYRFSKTPQLSKEIKLIEKFDVIISGNDYRAWDFWMNEGSRVEINYNISDPQSDLLLIVIKGEQNMRDWIRDPTSTDSVSSWRIAQGADVLQYESESDENYYFNFVNLRSSAVQVNVDLRFLIKVHDTAGSKSQCFVTDEPCSIPLNFFTSDVLLLTSPQTQRDLKGFRNRHKKYTDAMFVQQTADFWTINITFEKRLIAYLVFWGVILAILLLLLMLCSCASSSSYEQISTIGRTHLDNLYEEEKAKLENVDEATADLEDYMCLICFETRRSCFFEPCGHSAACLLCSVRISKETRPRCPLCRQQIQIIRKLLLY